MEKADAVEDLRVERTGEFKQKVRRERWHPSLWPLKRVDTLQVGNTYLNLHRPVELDAEADLVHGFFYESDGVRAVSRTVYGLLPDLRRDLVMQGVEVARPFLLSDLNVALLEDLKTEDGRGRRSSVNRRRPNRSERGRKDERVGC